LYSLSGFRYCDLLLSQGETEAVLERAEQTLKWARQQRASLLGIALDQLTLGRAHLKQGNTEQATNWLDQAVAGLRAAGTQHNLPWGLLARAALFRQTHNFPFAHQDLQEVFDIADNSGMRLHLTDYHLEMARLLLAEENTENLQHHINEAKRLITETGYHRRDAELADLISKTTDSPTQRTSACSTT
jgi:tetratricopeptide (TPR) repeat protein